MAVLLASAQAHTRSRSIAACTVSYTWTSPVLLSHKATLVRARYGFLRDMVRVEQQSTHLLVCGGGMRFSVCCLVHWTKGSFLVNKGRQLALAVRMGSCMFWVWAVPRRAEVLRWHAAASCALNAWVLPLPRCVGGQTVNRGHTCWVSTTRHDVHAGMHAGGSSVGVLVRRAQSRVCAHTAHSRVLEHGCACVHSACGCAFTKCVCVCAHGMHAVMRCAHAHVGVLVPRIGCKDHKCLCLGLLACS